eukprot:CAMPEP_0119069850 /NCGR_PEP_ID=MMETSP1178-20130426/30438_1 /TAXON_ID=33656 /ORGANISM="unid sp, Strain CCMP2000" /LENGTH=167 /DNA_ID=CAMNT_0007051649 /DNA_START=237 /DNA_END=740 /DNA_ORIENTATION=-
MLGWHVVVVRVGPAPISCGIRPPVGRLLALHSERECLALATEPLAFGSDVPVVAVVPLALDVHAPPLFVRAPPQPLVHLVVLEAGRGLLGLLQRLEAVARRVDPVGLPQPCGRLKLLLDLGCGVHVLPLGVGEDPDVLLLGTGLRAQRALPDARAAQGSLHVHAKCH